MTGLWTLCRLLKPVAECYNDVGMKQSKVCGVMKFCSFSLDGAFCMMHVSAVETAVTVMMSNTCGHAAQNVLWPGPHLVCI
jgi:hypothetical protein